MQPLQTPFFPTHRSDIQALPPRSHVPRNN
jgi:hypothetical protein